MAIMQRDGMLDVSRVVVRGIYRFKYFNFLLLLL